MINAKDVTDLMVSTLYNEESTNSTDRFLVVDGVISKFALNLRLVEENQDNIHNWLLDLDSAFQEKVGGGWSFLKGCVDKEGVQWGEHRDVEALFVLGVGSGWGKWVLPKELWRALPGRVPYYMVLDERILIDPDSTISVDKLKKMIK